MSTYYNTRNCPKNQVCARKDVATVIKRDNTLESQEIIVLFGSKYNSNCWKTENNKCWLMENGQPWLV